MGDGLARAGEQSCVQVSEVPCFHCGLPIPPDVHLSVEFQGQAKAVCCAGCQAVAEMIMASGHEQFYTHRESDSTLSHPDELSELFDYSQLTDDELNQTFSTAADHRVVLGVVGMRCAACGWLIEKQLLACDGVRRVRVSVERGEVHLELETDTTPISPMIAAIQAVGYRVCEPAQLNTIQRHHRQSALKRIGIAGLGSMQVMMVSVGLYAGWFDGMADHWVVILRWVCAVMTSVVFVYTGGDYCRSALQGLRARRVNIDLPIALVLVVALVASIVGTLLHAEEVYFDSICMFLFFISIGRYFESDARYRASLARPIRAPDRVLLKEKASKDDARHSKDDNAVEQWISAGDVKIGDIIEVPVGYMVPVDGVLLSPVGVFDYSVMTGESNPQSVYEGDEVVAGAIALQQAIELRVTRQWHESTLGQLDAAMSAGEMDKPADNVIINGVARYFTLVVIGLAMVTMAMWWSTSIELAFAYALSVLVVACPCALALATPTAITASVHGLFKRGLLVIKPHVIEQLAGVTDVVMDKTGTLTTGEFRVLDHWVKKNHSEDELLDVASALERGSRHPLAAAFARGDRRLRHCESRNEILGRGVEGCVNGIRYRLGSSEFVQEWFAQPVATINQNTESSTLEHQWLYLADEQSVLAGFCVGDTLRADAVSTVAGLHALGIRVHMNSGDPAANEDEWQRRLNMDSVRVAQSASQKQAHVERLSANGTVMTVGDGLNDGDMFRTAAVSVAIGTGADLVKGHADAVLCREQLHPLVEAVKLARYCKTVIKQNIAWAFLYNVLAVPMAMMGWIPPYVAAIGMTLSSILVTVNATKVSKRFGSKSLVGIPSSVRVNGSDRLSLN